MVMRSHKKACMGHNRLSRDTNESEHVLYLLTGEVFYVEMLGFGLA